MSALVLPDDQTEVPALLLPDRADAPISEITERFFRALLTKVPLDRIEEVHLFSPLRQGGVETGIAVIAAREIVVAPVVVPEALSLLLDETVSNATPLNDTPLNDALSDDRPSNDTLENETVSIDTLADEAPSVESISVESVSVESVSVANDSPYADDVQPQAEVQPPLMQQAAELIAAPIEVTTVPPVIVRHTVYTARYRLVQKGPDRGKWESTVVAEAEAPLITVETVVRGVQRRSGEDSETTRFTAAQVARALRLDLSAA